MKRTTLVNHIKGSYLQEQYLEAFLTQSAYIESLLRLFADYNYFIKMQEQIEKEDKLVLEVKKRIQRFSLQDLVVFLFQSALIDKQLKEILNTYKLKRNQVMHNLVVEMSSGEFEKELKEVCELGDGIINDDRFREIEDMIDGVQSSLERAPEGLPIKQIDDSNVGGESSESL